jgi:tyrosinase
MATGTPRAQALGKPLRYRRNVAALSPQQLELLVDGFRAVQGIRDDRGYAHWAGIHGLPLPAYCGIAHGTPLFLPWHRAYLYQFERAIRDQVPNAMLAWWDWRTPADQPSRIPKVLSAARAADGKANPLRNARVPKVAIDEGGALGKALGSPTKREPNTGAPLPTPEQIEELLDIDDFDTFSDQLDSIHGGIHGWVGGHMSQIAYSSYDPIFWHHHTMVDRLWRMWQNRHGRAGPPETLWGQSLPPFDMTVREVLSVTRLGYDYAERTVSREVAVGR